LNGSNANLFKSRAKERGFFVAKLQKKKPPGGGFGGIR
jgi:hypothetical protein